MKCDLCLKEPSAKGTILCRSCTETISRLMSLPLWLKNRSTDRTANVSQAKQLADFLKTENQPNSLSQKDLREASLDPNLTNRIREA